VASIVIQLNTADRAVGLGFQLDHTLNREAVTLSTLLPTNLEAVGLAVFFALLFNPLCIGQAVLRAFLAEFLPVLLPVAGVRRSLGV